MNFFEKYDGSLKPTLKAMSPICIVFLFSLSSSFALFKRNSVKMSMAVFPTSDFILQIRCLLKEMFYFHITPVLEPCGVSGPKTKVGGKLLRFPPT